MRLVLTISLAVVLSAALRAQTPAARVTLPAIVKKTFDQSYPGATIVTMAQVREKRGVTFRIDSMDKGRRRVLQYDASGKVIEIAEDVQEKELPKPVADALRSHRRAVFVSAVKVSRGGDVEYRLTARGSRKTSMVAKPDGTVLVWK